MLFRSGGRAVPETPVAGAPPAGRFAVRVGGGHVDRRHQTGRSIGDGHTGEADADGQGDDRGQTTPEAVSRARRCSTALVWICDTRLSVTLSTEPISARVSPSS